MSSSSRFRTTAPAGMCVLATALAACSSSNSTSGSTGKATAPAGSGSDGSSPSVKTGGNTAAAVKNGGDFVLGMSADPGNLDPQASAASNLYQFSHLAY